MENGRFTQEERQYLAGLDAVAQVRAKSIVYSKDFKRDCMRRYHAGQSPARIFAEAGLPSSLIGYKRIERAIYHWKEAEAKDSLTTTDAPSIRHASHIDTIKREKKTAIERQREIRARQVARLEEKLAKQRQRAKSREEKIIASQAAEIKALKDQVKSLKSLSALSRAAKAESARTPKADRFSLIATLREEDPGFNVSAACEALEVSRRGYYNWLHAADARERRDRKDLAAKEQVEKAFLSHGFKKGSRQVKDNLLREQGIVMNRKKIQRIMRKYGIVFNHRRKNPYHPIGTDGLPKAAPNLLDRNFHAGRVRAVLLADITYHRCLEGFCYTSMVIDAQTNEPLAHVTSTSLEEKFVLDTFDQLKGMKFARGALAHSDQGVHYTARAYRKKLSELGLVQSMSRKACCWDNASMESWFGRMKEQLGPTSSLSAAEVIKKVNEYVHYYRYCRGQERLGWLTPAEYAAKLAA